MSTPQHLSWLVDSGRRLRTTDGLIVELWDLQHEDNSAILSSWAKHFRQHYCDDTMLPLLVKGTGMSKAQFLRDVKFPDKSSPPGPSIRSGDFAEILIADYIQFKLGYWCPRELRYDCKWSRNESAKGCDIVGFRIQNNDRIGPNDELFIFEAKAQLSGSSPKDKLQEAINDSMKDSLREAMTLNALKQRLIEKRDVAGSQIVERFQDVADRPFRRINGASAVYSEEVYDEQLLLCANAASHPNRANLKLVVVKGKTLMGLVHSLYERAAHEA